MLFLAVALGFAFADTVRADVEVTEPSEYTATTGTVIVYKAVINNDAGTSVPADFTLWLEHAPGGMTSTVSFAGEGSGTVLEVAAGNYAVTESSLTGYTASFSVDCSGTLSVGETKTCIVTNDDDPIPFTATTGTLIVIKNVINDNGGTAVAGDFQLHVNYGGDPGVTENFTGDANGTSFILPAGSYNVSEDEYEGYATSYDEGCSGMITAGTSTTCIVTNDDFTTATTATLIVIKRLQNDYRGLMTPEDFLLEATYNLPRGTVTDSTVQMAIAPSFATTTQFNGSESGTVFTVAPGDYKVTEHEYPEYNTTYTDNCSGSINAGQTITCIVTNYYRSSGGGGRYTEYRDDNDGEDDPEEGGGDEPADEGGGDEGGTATTTPRVLGIEDFVIDTGLCTLTEQEALYITADVNDILAHLGRSRDLELEQYFARFLSPLTIPAGTTPDTAKMTENFTVYGTESNQRLGSGERAGVVNSYREVYGRLPVTDCDWQNAVKIANTTLPLDLNPERENKMLNTFEAIYGRKADREDVKDDIAIKVMTYGIRPQIRDLDAEWTAVLIFERVFGKRPSTAGDWDANRAIAYSGLGHNLMSKDLTNRYSRIMSIKVNNTPIR